MSEPRKYLKGSVRERLIRKLKLMSFPVFERDVQRKFSSFEREQVLEQISALVNEGYLHRLGTGKRGSPYRFALSATWPFNKCPLCGHIEFPASTKTSESVVMGL